MYPNMTIEKIKDNTYKMVVSSPICDCGGGIITFSVDDFNGLDYDITSRDISKDGVLFRKELYETPDDNTVVIGIASYYKDRIFQEDKLITARIMDSTVRSPKQCIERYFM